MLIAVLALMPFVFLFSTPATAALVPPHSTTTGPAATTTTTTGPASPPMTRGPRIPFRVIDVKFSAGPLPGAANGHAFAQAPAPQPVPPFTQCPAAGLDASCAFLVVVNPDGTTSVLNDPTQGFVDGADDSLVGVLNNSGVPVTTITLASDMPIFGFDGDGVCATSPVPSGCPFGSTSYEGPGTSFSNLTTLVGDVNFSPALGLGQSTYFSLESSPIAGEVRSAETFGNGNASEDNHQCFTGSWPVNCATGNFWHTFADLAIPGRGPAIDFNRTYNALDSATDGPFGFGWSSSYTMSATTELGGNITVRQENGSQVSFAPTGSGSYLAPPRVFATLAKNPDATLTFTRRRREQFVFSASGQLLKMVDLNRYTTSLAYDATAQLTTVTDPAGRSLTFSHEASGKISGVIDPAGRRLSYAYDGSGNLSAVTDVTGGVTGFTYDPGHRVLTMSDRRGGIVANVYDASGRVVSQSDPLGRQRTLVYDSTGTTITDPKGNVEVQVYDAQRQLSSLTRGAGTPEAATSTFTYDTVSLALITATDPNGHVVTQTHDPADNLTSTTDALGRTTSFAYDNLNDLTSATDPKGVTTTLTYDAAGNFLSRSRPLSATADQVTAFNYGEGGNTHAGDVTSLVDPEKGRWSFTYDATGDLSGVIDPLGHKTAAAFDAIGRRTSSVSANGNATGYAYEPDNLIASMTDPLGHLIQRQYDANRNLNAVIDPKGNKTTFTYDADNELVTTTRADGTTLRTDYFPDGTANHQIDAAGDATTYDYDALARPTTMTDPLARTTAYFYDLVGNLVAKQDPAGNCAASPKSACTTITYDAANERTAIDYSDGTPAVSAITYDADGQRTTMTDGTGTSTWTWDSLNRLVSATNGATVSGGGQTVGYTYDLKNQNTGITYPGGLTVARAFDGAGNLNLVKDWIGNQTSFAYDADNNLVNQNYANGTTGTFSYDQTDRLMGTDYRRLAETTTSSSEPTSTSSTTVASPIAGAGEGQGSAPTGGRDVAAGASGRGSGPLAKTGAYILVALLIAIVLIALGLVLRGRGPGGPTNVVSLLLIVALAGAVLYPKATHAATGPTVSFAGFAYTRDAANLLGTAQASGVPADNNTYGYTALNQLKAVNGSPFTYDPADNLTHIANGTAQSYDAGNQLCWSASTASSGSCASPPAGSTSFTYDSRGNRTKTTPPTGAPVNYTYDQANRLTGVGDVSYVYNGDGLRMAKTVSGSSTAYTWDMAFGLPLLLTEGAGPSTTKYIYGPGNMPLEQVDPAGRALFYHHDQLGSTRLLTDQSGNVAASFTYDSYGKLAASTGSISTPLGFAGEYTDPETGLQYLRARYYDPITGQFLNRDPAVGSTRDAYGYAGRSPVNLSDPSGLDSYSYDFDLGEVGGAAFINYLLRAHCSDIFPIEGCDDNFHVGDRLALKEDMFFYTQSFPVQVTGITDTSTSFVALPGHPEGPGRTITFQFCDDSSGHTHLNVSTSANGSLLVNWFGVRQGNFFIARQKWSDLADNLSAYYAVEVSGVHNGGGGGAGGGGGGGF